MNLGNVFRFGKPARQGRSVAAATSAALRPERLASLRVIIPLAEIWAHQGHAVLSARGLGEGHLVHGEASDETGLALLEAALAGDDVHVCGVRKPKATGHIDGAAALIWRAVLHGWTSSHEIFARLSYQLHCGPAWGRIQDLPVAPALREVLVKREEGRQLDDLLRSAGLDPMHMAMELSALSRLAIIELRRNGESASVSQRVRLPEVQADEDGPSVDSLSGSDRMTRKRDRALRSGSTSRSRSRSRRRAASAPRQLDDLRRQLRILTKVDPFRAFGLGRAASEEQIARATRRLRDRYAVRDSDTAVMRGLLAQIDAEVTRIARVLGEQRRARERAIQAELDPLLEKGCSLLNRSGPVAALEILERALHQNPASAAHHTWYGWALFQSPERPIQERAFLALEHLRTADGLGGGPAELAGFIAEVEQALCAPDSAQVQAPGDESPTEDPVLFGQANEDSELLLGEVAD